MSGYRYDYPLAPASRSGFRSALTNITVAVVIAAVSGIAGAAVVLELVAPPAPSPGPNPVSGQEQRVLAPEPGASTATASNRSAPVTNAGERVAESNPAAAQSAAPQPASRPSAPQSQAGEGATPAPVPAPPKRTAESAPAPAAPPKQEADSRTSERMSASELTFAKGYAKRRAAREASVKSAAAEAPKDDVQKGEVKDANNDDAKDAAKDEVAKDVKKHENTKVTRKRRQHGSDAVVAYRNYRNDRGDYRADRGDYNERYERREPTFGRVFGGFGYDAPPRPVRRVEGPGLFGDLF